MKFELIINNNKFNEFKVAPRDLIMSTDLLTESIKLFFKEVISPNKKYFCLIVFVTAYLRIYKIVLIFFLCFKEEK